MLHKIMENLSSIIYLHELRGTNLFEQEPQGFAALKTFHYDTLMAGDRKGFHIEGGYYSILIPITGDFLYTDPVFEDMEIAVGQAIMISRAESFDFQLKNPFEGDEISFLVLTVAHTIDIADFVNVFEFNLAAHKNALVEITEMQFSATQPLPFRISIGQFSGRQEVVKSVVDFPNVFCYVLAGAFEISGRLLQPLDGLAIWDIEEIDMEALSNNALVLMVEMK